MTSNPSLPELVMADARSVRGELPSLGVKADADQGVPEVSERVVYLGPASEIEVGVWESTPGSWRTVERSDTEIICILHGRAVIHSSEGNRTEIGPGDVVVLPRLWTGRWEILETLRKVYVSHRGT